MLAHRYFQDTWYSDFHLEKLFLWLSFIVVESCLLDHEVKKARAQHAVIVKRCDVLINDGKTNPEARISWEVLILLIPAAHWLLSRCNHVGSDYGCIACSLSWRVVLKCWWSEFCNNHLGSCRCTRILYTHQGHVLWLLTGYVQR